MGILGWTEAATLSTTIPAIELAYQGRTELLRAIFGSGKPDPKKPERFIPATRKNLRRALLSAAGQRTPRNASPSAKGSGHR